MRRILLFLICFAALAAAALCPVSAQTDQPARNERTVDLSSAFGSLRGTAVFFDPARDSYAVYAPELADVRSSPCSTFKIFSAYAGLLTGAIDPRHSVRRWDGTEYWQPLWNRDVDLKTAFGCSCVWYFRQVIDDIGPAAMQAFLDRYGYGNRDCSDWGGRLNTNEPLYALKGFWIESSLRISPREQTEVLSRLFAPAEDAKQAAAQQTLKDIMLVQADEARGLRIYGKTGFGVVDGRPADAWFAGFYEYGGTPVYFAVRLDDPANPACTSAAAKDIALRVICSEAASLFCTFMTEAPAACPGLF